MSWTLSRSTKCGQIVNGPFSQFHHIPKFNSNIQSILQFKISWHIVLINFIWKVAKEFTVSDVSLMSVILLRPTMHQNGESSITTIMSSTWGDNKQQGYNQWRSFLHVLYYFDQVFMSQVTRPRELNTWVHCHMS